jgi:chorismate dehydratase
VDRKIRIGAVSYLNTKPLIYGLKDGHINNEMELVMDYPAKIAQMLLEDEIDIGLVPVAIIPKLKKHFILTDYCIGCYGAVSSVSIFAENPIEELTTILLDYQSRTSVMLAKILVKHYWKLNIEWVNTNGEDYRDQIKGSVGGLVIGDRAFQQQKVSPFVYDLGEAWKKHTGLPFVFAAWVSNKEIPVTFINEFNRTMAFGLNHLEQIVADNKRDDVNLMEYYTKNIHYNLDENKRKGLALFLKMLGEEEGYSQLSF